MDVNEFRGLITIVTMACFLGICRWAYSGRNRDRFDEDALLPFADDAPLENGGGGQGVGDE